MKRTSFGRGGYGRSRRGFEKRQKPVEVGKEYDVTISELSKKGDGVAKIEGFVIFVANSKPGQQAKIRITQVSERFATATVVEQGPSQTEEG